MVKPRDEMSTSFAMSRRDSADMFKIMQAVLVDHAVVSSLPKLRPGKEDSGSMGQVAFNLGSCRRVRTNCLLSAVCCLLTAACSRGREGSLKLSSCGNDRGPHRRIRSTRGSDRRGTRYGIGAGDRSIIGWNHNVFRVLIDGMAGSLMHALGA